VALGERVRLGAVVDEVVEHHDHVVVRWTESGVAHEERARTVVLATTADVSRRVGVNLPPDLREALGRVKYGPHVSSAFLTNEVGTRPWDDVYAIAAPKASFAIALNQASIVRGTESARRPGGSFMTFAPAALGAALLDKPDQEVLDLHLRDLDTILGHGFADSVQEAHTKRWEVGSPYCFPGRAALQSTLTRGSDRIFLAGDFLGTLYTESAVTSGFEAAQRAASILATDRQRRPLPVPAGDTTHLSVAG
jgi:oxygen-dependent protoporphyrinogen oxidase